MGRADSYNKRVVISTPAAPIGILSRTGTSACTSRTAQVTLSANGIVALGGAKWQEMVTGSHSPVATIAG